MTRWFPLTLFFLWLPLVPACARAQPARPAAPVPLLDDRPLAIGAVHPDHARVPRYGRVEIAVDLHGRYANPFDPADIELDGLVTSPSGRRFVAPGFYMQNYTRHLQGRQEVLAPVGKPAWRLRLCASEPGPYSIIAVARDRTGSQVEAPPVRFAAQPDSRPGFVRRAAGDARYFAFDNGATYLPIGANVCWASSRGTFDYDRWFARYGAAHCTYARLWLNPAWTTFALDRQGANKIDLSNAWRLEYVLKLAEKYGLYLMLCLDSYNELRLAKDGASPFWEQTPQNAANGGPLREPGDFWTNPEMARLYRNQLRYLVARYSAFTHVMAWELWNEVDIVSPAAWNETRVRAWHESMGRYLHGLDPYHHLVTTSFSNPDGKPSIDRLPEMDFIQTHTYGARDLAAEIASRQRQKAVYGKPHVVGECGIDGRGVRERQDRAGVALHNALWSGLMSGGAGSAMFWWWDSYIDPDDLYSQFAGITRFFDGIDPIRLALQPESRTGLRYAVKPARLPLADLDLPGGDRLWEASPANRLTEVRIEGESEVRVDTALSGLLHGEKNYPLRVLLLRGRDAALAWVQNSEHDWYRVLVQKDAPRPVPRSVLDLSGMANGLYQVSLWDTERGAVIQQEQLQTKNGRLSVPLPPVRTDLAVKALREQ